ncbi:MAG: 4-oxalocrotonate tautomerase family protein [Anaerolineae bacterium]
MPTVLIYWSPGRNAEQKKRIIEKVTDTLVEHGNARKEDVLIIFQDIQPGDAGRGGKVIGEVESSNSTANSSISD